MAAQGRISQMENPEFSCVRVYEMLRLWETCVFMTFTFFKIQARPPLREPRILGLSGSALCLEVVHKPNSFNRVEDERHWLLMFVGCFVFLGFGIMMHKEHNVVHTGKSFPFLHMFSWNIIWKTRMASSSLATWRRRQMFNRAQKKKQLANINTSLAFKYFNEELGAFGHEESEDEGWCEAGNRAENHKQPPALKVQRSHRKIYSGAWYHQPGQTCRNRHTHD